MAHNITDTDGAVYSKTAAWHGLGLVIQEDMSPTEAMKIAGLDWTVSKVGPVTAGTATSDDYNAIVRSDNNAILSIQSPDYQIVQNSDVFDMAYNLGADIKIESALSMNGGKRLVVLCKTGEMDGVNGQDPIAQYMALINSHDGTLAEQALPTTVRIVCQNTLSMAMAGGKKSFRIVHSGDMKKKREAMAEALKFYAKTGKLFEDKVQTLVRKELTKADIQKFWLDVWGMVEEPVVANPTLPDDYENYLRATVTIRKWADTFDAERAELGGCSANLWLAANAVTKELQHRIPARGRKPSFESSAFSNLIGKNQETTLDVMKFALTLV